MDKIIPYPNQGCRSSKIHSIVDFDIFGLDSRVTKERRTSRIDWDMDGNK